MTRGIDDIPKEFVKFAQRYCRYVPGDWPSIACAQWANETGWGVAEGLGGRVWREGWNGGGIKQAKDARFQSGAIEGHAIYAGLEEFFKDRRRILTNYFNSDYKAGRVPWDCLSNLDDEYAPRQEYRAKLIRLIEDHRLYRLDPRPST